MEAAEQAAANAGQGGLFDAFEPEPDHELKLIDTPPWDETVKLTEEKTAIGFYLSGHPFTAMAKAVRAFAKTELSRLIPRKELQWIAGTALEIRTKIGQRGKMAFITLDDATAKRDVMVYSETFDAARNKLQSDALLIIEAKVSEDSYGGGSGLRIIAERILDLAEARSRFARMLQLEINGQADAAKLKQIMGPFTGGDCPITIGYRNGDAVCQVELGEAWRVTLRDELLASLRGWLGEKAVAVRY
jgi:DNA polymerase-3 subunit alpha